MKKALMLVAAVALLAAPVFAEVEVAISGEATTTFGFDLDQSWFGLNSDVSSDITLTVGAMDGESMGEGNWYGVIGLTGASLKWDSDGGDELKVMVDGTDTDDDAEYKIADIDGDGEDDPLLVKTQYAITAPTVAAKITNGNIYIQLQSEAGLDADFVAEVEEDDVVDFDVDYGETGSLTFGGTFGPVTAALEVATAGDYDNDGTGVAIEADIAVDVAPIKFEADWVAGFGPTTDISNDMAFGVQATVDVAPIKVVVAFDGINSTTFDWELGAAVDLDLAPLTIGLDYYYGDDMDLKASVKFDNAPFTAEVAFGLYDLASSVANAMYWEANLDLTFAVTSGIKLAAGFDIKDPADTAIVMGAEFNATFTELVDNVEFKAGWRDAEDLTSVGADDTNELGELFVSAKLSY